MAKITFKRGTRAQLASAVTANLLNQGEPYLVTNENVLAVGTGPNTYFDTAKKDHTHDLSNIQQSGANVGQAAIWNGSVWTPTTIRQILTAARTYYVRTDGNNSNTGLVNSSGGAFLTIQKAVDVASSFDNGGFDITIRIVAGTYTGQLTLKPFIGQGKIIIRGDLSNLTSVILSNTADLIVASETTGYDLQYMRLQTSGAGSCIVNGVLTFSNLAFGNCAGNHVVSGDGSRIRANGPYTLNGAATSHLIADLGQIIISGQTVTITGAPTVGFFAVARYCGTVSAQGCAFSGSLTGQRYFADANGVIFTAGAGPTALPGTSAGTTGNGGQYV